MFKVPKSKTTSKFRTPKTRSSRSIATMQSKGQRFEPAGIVFSKEGMALRKDLNFIDRLVLDFVSALDTTGSMYVIVSGYVSILFGRSRSSEDVDIIIGKQDEDEFHAIWDAAVKGGFECLNASECETAYEEYFSRGIAVRFSRKGEFIPNIELKAVKTELDSWVLGNRVKVVVNGRKQLFVSSIELQIPFKLLLGSEKDIEDAKYLYRLFREDLDMGLLDSFNRRLKTERKFRRFCALK